MPDPSPWSVSCVVNDILVLLGPLANVGLWAPGRPYWAFALQKQDSRVTICVDGALTIAQWIWPDHFEVDATYSLSEIVQHLAAKIRLLREPGMNAVFPVALPDTQCGRCCVFADRKSLPCVMPDDAVIGGDAITSWVALKVPAPIPDRVPSWRDQMGPGDVSAELFFRRVELPVAAFYFAPPAREHMLSSQFFRELRAEITRLRYFKLEVPAWLADETRWAELVALAVDATTRQQAAEQASPAGRRVVEHAHIQAEPTY